MWKVETTEQDGTSTTCLSRGGSDYSIGSNIQVKYFSSIFKAICLSTWLNGVLIQAGGNTPGSAHSTHYPLCRSPSTPSVSLPQSCSNQ